MYRFVQRTQGKTEKWQPINVKNVQDIETRNFPMITVLSVSAFGETVDQSTLEYQGDLYFDIDNADISVSISSAQLLVSKLQDMGIVSPHIWLSGKKGFHVVIPAKLFSSGKKRVYLPYIYGMMAEYLDVVGLDHSVYSGGRGRMWRQPNIQRADNQAYKVGVTVDEVFSLTPEVYAAFCSNPRTPIKQAKDSHSPDLSEMFMDCSRQVLDAMQNREEYIFTSDERLEEIDHEASPPTCLTNLLDAEGAKPDANFNRVAMNLAGYIKVSGVDSEIYNKWVDRLASHNGYNSATYTTETLRTKHIEQHLRRAQHDPNMGFVPAYFFSAVKPCGGCILCDGTLTGRERSESDAIAGNPIVVYNNQYHIRKTENDRVLSTFIIEPVAYSMVDEDADFKLRDSIHVNIRFNQHGEEQIIPCELNESVWNSTSSFKKALEGIGNAVWYGSDNDLSMLKHYLFSRDVEMSEIIKTNRVGLRIHESSHGKMLVYVDSSGSVNSVGQRETHKLTHNVEACPRAFEQEDFQPDNPEHVEVIRSLFGMNAEYKMALMVGWFMACHIKPHFEALANQFPLLELWGGAGSGKTKSASLLGYLHAMDLEGRDNIASLGGTTPWAAAEHVASSTSSPRLLDEFNRPKLEKHGRYAKLSDMMKSAWGSQPHMRGTISNTKSGGAEVVSLYMSGPVCTMSEQQPDEPPLMQRSIQVNLNRSERVGCEKAFKNVYINRHILSRLAKVFIKKSVTTPMSFVRNRMDDWYDQIPDETILDSRPHYSYRVVLTGLDFMDMALKEEGVDLTKEITALQQSILKHLNVNLMNISQEKNHSVVDRVLQTLSSMAGESSAKEGAPLAIEAGKHYVKTGEDLYVDFSLAYNLVLRYAHGIRQPLEITSVGMFRTLIKDEPYYVGFVDAEFSPRKVIKLNLVKMDEKGIDISLFDSFE